MAPWQAIASLSLVPQNGGYIDIYNQQGSTDIIADVEGYVASYSATVAGFRFQKLPPQRILSQVVVAGTTLQAADGLGNIPFLTQLMLPSPPRAAVVDVAVTAGSAAGYLTLWQDGVSQPLASQLLFSQGQTIANGVVVPIATSSGGFIRIFTNVSSVQVVIDVTGYYG